MRKLAYLFVMIAGMTLATVNVNAQDARSTSDPVKKEATAACCKSGDAASAKKCDTKGTASSASCTKSATTQNSNDKSGTCNKSKTETTVSEAKLSKTVN